MKRYEHFLNTLFNNNKKKKKKREKNLICLFIYFCMIKKEKPKVMLPSSIFESEVEEKVGLLNKAAPQSGNIQ